MGDAEGEEVAGGRAGEGSPGRRSKTGVRVCACAEEEEERREGSLNQEGGLRSQGSTDFGFKQTATYCWVVSFKTTSKASLEMMFLVVMFFRDREGF